MSLQAYLSAAGRQSFITPASGLERSLDALQARAPRLQSHRRRIQTPAFRWSLALAQWVGDCGWTDSTAEFCCARCRRSLPPRHPAAVLLAAKTARTATSIAGSKRSASPNQTWMLNAFEICPSEARLPRPHPRLHPLDGTTWTERRCTWWTQLRQLSGGRTWQRRPSPPQPLASQRTRATLMMQTLRTTITSSTLHFGLQQLL